jgi:hypothetical protein
LQDPIEPFRVDSEIAAPKVCSPMGERFAVESANAMSEEMITHKLADDAMRDQHFNSRRLLYSRDNKRRDTATSPSAQRLRQLKLKQVMVDEVEAEEEGEAEEEVSMEYGDGTGHFVSWLDWSFHVSVDPYHGMRIYDLKFKGERIAYEISTQEYFASYSSAGSVAQVSFYDSVSYYEEVSQSCDRIHFYLLTLYRLPFPELRDWNRDLTASEGN